MFDGSGSTGIAKGEIAKDVKLLSCPKSLVIDYAKASKLWEKCPFSDSPEIAVRVFLCHQRVLGSDSKWAPYISILPKVFDTPLYFNAEELELLKGSNIYGEVELRRHAWKEEWRAAIELLPGSLDKTLYTWELYLWACTVLTSRSFPSSIVLQDGGESYPVLAPLVDSLNHKPLVPVVWTSTADEFSISAGANIHAGEEVFNNYGPKGNEELLMGYGFCIENNEFDVVSLKLRSGSHTEADGGNVFHLSKSQPLPEKLKEFALYMCANIHELELLRSGQVSRRCELAALSTLNDALSIKAQNISVPSISNPTNRERNAIIYIGQQLDILRYSLTTIREQLSGDIGVRLETIFSDSRYTTFASSVLDAFSLTDISDIRTNEFEDEVMLLFLCYLSVSEPDEWLQAMHARYDSEIDAEYVESFRELYDACISELAMVDSELFDERWTTRLLAWASKVVDGESVVVNGEVWIVTTPVTSQL